MLRPGAAVAGAPSSIGYVEPICATQHELNYGAMRNPAGQFIKANFESIIAAASGANFAASGLQAVNTLANALK